MAYISEAKHRELENQLYQLFLQSESWYPLTPDMEALKKDAQLLQRMFNQYQDKINELLKLIREYQEIQRRTRVQLRKQQLSGKQQTTIGTTTVRNS